MLALQLPARPPLQFESSSPSRYAITRSVTLAEALAAQAAAGGPAADEALAGIAAGTWTAVKLPLADFARPDGALAGGSGGSGAVAAGSFRADRLTIGLCLQRLDGCGQDTPSLSFCLDKLVIVNAA